MANYAQHLPNGQQLPNGYALDTATGKLLTPEQTTEDYSRQTREYFGTGPGSAVQGAPQPRNVSWADPHGDGLPPASPVGQPHWRAQYGGNPLSIGKPWGMDVSSRPQPVQQYLADMYAYSNAPYQGQQLLGWATDGSGHTLDRPPRPGEPVLLEAPRRGRRHRPMPRQPFGHGGSNVGGPSDHYMFDFMFGGPSHAKSEYSDAEYRDFLYSQPNFELYPRT